MSFLKSIQAELIKLKFPPILWLMAFSTCSVLALVFIAHILDVNNIAVLGKNPWLKVWTAGVSIFSVFIANPFAIMLISAAVFIEHQSNTWKYLYTTPKNRSHIFYAKLSAIVLFIIGTISILSIGLLLCGYLLNFIYPEIEFGYYTPPTFKLITKFTHTIISLLGVIGIHYFLSHRFKGFLVPASFGVIAFIIGIIIGALNKPIALFYPYAYPIVGQEHNMFRTDNVGIVGYGWINNVEIFSVIWFLVFIVLANFLEVRKQVG